MHASPALGNFLRFTVCWHKRRSIRVNIPSFLFVFLPAKEGSLGLWDILTNIWGSILKTTNLIYTLEFTPIFALFVFYPSSPGKKPGVTELLLLGSHSKKISIHPGSFIGTKVFKPSNLPFSSFQTASSWLRETKVHFPSDHLHCHHLNLKQVPRSQVLKTFYKKTTLQHLIANTSFLTRNEIHFK